LPAGCQQKPPRQGHYRRAVAEGLASRERLCENGRRPPALAGPLPGPGGGADAEGAAMDAQATIVVFVEASRGNPAFYPEACEEEREALAQLPAQVRESWAYALYVDEEGDLHL